MKMYTPIAQAIAAGTFPQYIDESHKDFKIFKEMYKGGYVDAINSSADDGDSFMNPSLRSAGRKLLGD
ncbi:hypothetical protein D9M68_946250 [compost metagenome]